MDHRFLHQIPIFYWINDEMRVFESFADILLRLIVCQPFKEIQYSGHPMWVILPFAKHRRYTSSFRWGESPICILVGKVFILCVCLTNIWMDIFYTFANREILLFIMQPEIFAQDEERKTPMEWSNGWGISLEQRMNVCNVCTKIEHQGV